MKRYKSVPEFGYGFGLSTDFPHPDIVTPIPPRRRRAVVDLDPNDEPPDEEWTDDDCEDDDPLPLDEIYSRY
jgi:hypothetical protein